MDISGLLKECSGMPSLQKLVDQAESSPKANGDKPKEGSKDRLNSRNEIKALSQLFNGEELDIIRRHGGDHFQGSHDVHSTPPISGPRPRKAPRRVLIDDGGVADGFDGPTSPLSEGPGMSNSGMYNQTVGSLEGVFKHVSRPPAEFRDASNIPTVSPRPPLPIHASPLRLTTPSTARNGTVSFPASYRRRRSLATRSGSLVQRRQCCDGQSAMA